MPRIKDITGNEVVALAMNDPNVPKVYANGFVSGMTSSDMFIVLQNAGESSVVLQVPHILAKSLAQDLTRTIEQFEQEMGIKLPTMREVTESLVKREKDEQ